MPKAPSAKKRTPTKKAPGAAEVRKLVIEALEHEDPFKRILPILQAAVSSTATVALLFNDSEHSFRIIEQLGLPAKQRRALQGFLVSVAEVATSDDPTRTPVRNQGTVFVFSESEAKQRGCTSALVYYLARSEKLVSALVFCQSSGEFDKRALAILDQVAGPVSLLAENRFYKEKSEEADGLVNLDGLTGLYNHRYFQETLSNELLKSQRFGHAVSLLLVDVDHFKKVNDKYGHPQGDVVLKEVAQILKNTVRAYDVPARYGGEEFAVVLPHADPAQAYQVAERVRRAVQACVFPGRTPRETLRVTASFGVAASPANAKTKAELIDRADQALYLAKSEGRNKVCMSLANSSEPIRVGFCPASLESAYYRDVLRGMEDVVREIKQIELSIHAPPTEADYAELPGLFKEFAQEELHAVAVCTQSPNAVADLKILHKAKLPVYFFNVPQPINDKKIRSYVGYDQTEAGAAVASYLGRVLRGRGQVAIIEGLDEPTSQLRVKGFKKALRAFPEMTIVASESANWQQSEAKKVAARLLRTHKDLDAIFAVSDAMALGATEAVQAKGRHGSIFVVGLDGTKDALDSIRDGALTATLDTGPREMGRILLRTIVRGLIREEKVSRQIHSPINMVTAENVEHALNP